MYGLSNGFGSGSMMGWFGGGITMIAFWVLIVVLIVWIVRELKGNNRDSRSSSGAIDILKERYAKGDISKEEFEAKKKGLND